MFFDFVIYQKSNNAPFTDKLEQEKWFCPYFVSNEVIYKIEDDRNFISGNI